MYEFWHFSSSHRILHFFRDNWLKVSCNLPRRKDILTEIFSVIHYSLYLRSVQLSHRSKVISVNLKRIAWKQLRWDNFILNELIYFRFSTKVIETLVCRFSFWYKIFLVAFRFRIFETVFNGPVVNCVASHTKISHTVWVGCINIRAIYHSSFKFLCALNTVIQSDIF